VEPLRRSASPMRTYTYYSLVIPTRPEETCGGLNTGVPHERQEEKRRCRVPMGLRRAGSHKINDVAVQISRSSGTSLAFEGDTIMRTDLLERRSLPFGLGMPPKSCTKLHDHLLVLQT
jgi:hypothetical protein